MPQRKGRQPSSRLEARVLRGGGVPGTGSGKGVFLKGRWSRASREGRDWRRYRKKEGGKSHEETQNWGCRRHLGWGTDSKRLAACWQLPGPSCCIVGASGSSGEGSREAAGDAESVCRRGQGTAFTEALGETLLDASGSVVVSLALIELLFIDLLCFVWLSSYILQLLKQDSAAKGPWWGGGGPATAAGVQPSWLSGERAACVCVSVWESPKQTHSLILRLCLLCLQEIRSM